MPLVEIHPHARGRAPERGVSEEEIVDTVTTGERSPAKFGRTSFRKTFGLGYVWRQRQYANKKVEAIAVEITSGWLVLTVITRYF